MDSVRIAKSIVDIVVSTGVGIIVGNVVKQTTPVGVKTYQKALISIGGFVLSSLVSSLAAKHAIEEIDETVEILVDLKNLTHKKTIDENEFEKMVDYCTADVIASEIAVGYNRA